MEKMNLTKDLCHEKLYCLEPFSVLLGMYIVAFLWYCVSSKLVLYFMVFIRIKVFRDAIKKSRGSKT